MTYYGQGCDRAIVYQDTTYYSNHMPQSYMGTADYYHEEYPNPQSMYAPGQGEFLTYHHQPTNMYADPNYHQQRSFNRGRGSRSNRGQQPRPQSSHLGALLTGNDDISAENQDRRSNRGRGSRSYQGARMRRTNQNDSGQDSSVSSEQVTAGTVDGQYSMQNNNWSGSQRGRGSRSSKNNSRVDRSKSSDVKTSASNVVNEQTDSHANSDGLVSETTNTNSDLSGPECSRNQTAKPRQRNTQDVRYQSKRQTSNAKESTRVVVATQHNNAVRSSQGGDDRESRNSLRRDGDDSYQKGYHGYSGSRQQQQPERRNRRGKDNVYQCDSRGGRRDRRCGGAVFEVASYEQTDSGAEGVKNRKQTGSRKGKPNSKKVTPSGKEGDENQRGMLIEEVTLGSYECMVCCDVVRREAAVWHCTACYHIFHLHCIKRWARSSSAVFTDGGAGGWRCPACQNTSHQMPSQYRCYCSKVRDPVFDRFETPHSCGQVCGKNRSGHCTHPCNILCHPGPCPSCHASITQTCQCGKSKQKVPCGQAATLKCVETCQKTLNCGKHECQQICHAGPCEPCDNVITQDCHCSKESQTVVCGTSESYQDSFSCGQPCCRELECKNHRCEATCHPADCAPCPLLPELVEYCPCGKTRLSELNGDERRSCLDAVPPCTLICDRPLPCGSQGKPHHCSEPCHTGHCSPCSGQSQLRCRCGAVTQTLPCTEVIGYTEGNPLLCEGRCNKKLSCGSHRCAKKCCVDKDHVCHQICGRKLSCGLHRCEEVCHRGNCPRCYNVSFDELHCECGVEILFPPIHCGTKPPECSQPCTRQHECDHMVVHPCHSEVKCPPCIQLTEKWCHGKHELRKNILCHVTEVSCGMKCGKPLPCQQHRCLTVCHKGECLAEGVKCQQRCEEKRESCGHPCGVACHAGQPCPNTSCKTQVEVKCVCGNRVETHPCHLFWSPTRQYQSLATSVLAMKISDTQDGQSFDISSLTKPNNTNSPKRLECNADCAQLERNKRVAVALQIQNPELSSRLGAPTYTQFLKDYTRQNPSFVASVEGALSDLVNRAQSGKQPRRSHAFKPMKSDNRKLVHELASYYGCETLSYDEEPCKNVVATAHKGKCWQPTVSLTALIQRELHPKAPTPIPLNGNMDKLKSAADAAKQSTNLLGGAQASAPPPAWGKSPPSFNTTSASLTSSSTHSDGWTRLPLRSAKKETAKPEETKPVIDYFDMTE